MKTNGTQISFEVQLLKERKEMYLANLTVKHVNTNHPIDTIIMN